VFEVFKKFKVFVEKQSGYCIKSLRSAKGGEFTSNEFKEFCEANEIRCPLTVLRSPQQNGVVERKNRTILNMVRGIFKLLVLFEFNYELDPKFKLFIIQ